MDDPNPNSNETLTINGDQFTLPPLLRRRFVVELDISRAAFDERALPLMEELQAEGRFDAKQMKEKWEFQLEIKNQVPRPKVRLTHSPMIIRKAEGNRPRTAIELFPPVGKSLARFILEQDRSDDHPTRFEDLETEIQQWLPRVMGRFQIEEVGGFALLYENEFRRSRYADFWEGEKTLLLSKLLKLFKNNYEGDGFVTPLLIELNSDTELPHSRILFKMRTSKQPGKELALNLNLEFTSLSRSQRVTLSQALVEVQTAHKLLFDNFVRHLSPEALKAFTS